MKKLPTNCPNCGAPLSIDGYCSYCNTKVRYSNELEFQSFLHGGITDIMPTEILFKFKADDGTLIIIPFIGRPQSIEVDYDSYDAIGYSGNIISKYYNFPEIKFEFIGHINPNEEIK